jgi:hypothetical protein
MYQSEFKWYSNKVSKLENFDKLNGISVWWTVLVSLLRKVKYKTIKYVFSQRLTEYVSG